MKTIGMNDQKTIRLRIVNTIFTVLLLIGVPCLFPTGALAQRSASVTAVVQPDVPVRRILIAYHSAAGHTQDMAEAVARGAGRVPGTELRLSRIQDVRPEEVAQFHAVILGTPVQNANPAPEMLTFIRSWPFEGQPMKNKIGAVFVSAGGISAGEELVQMNLIHAMLMFGMVVVGGDDWTSAFGASAVTDEKPFVDKSINGIFIKKAEGLGERVARAAHDWDPD